MPGCVASGLWIKKKVDTSAAIKPLSLITLVCKWLRDRLLLTSLEGM